MLDVDIIDVKATDMSFFTCDGKQYNKRGLFWLEQLNNGQKKMGTPPFRYDREQNENQKTEEGSKQTISQPIDHSNFCIYSWLHFNPVNEHS